MVLIVTDGGIDIFGIQIEGSIIMHLYSKHFNFYNALLNENSTVQTPDILYTLQFLLYIVKPILNTVKPILNTVKPILKQLNLY